MPVVAGRLALSCKQKVISVVEDSTGKITKKQCSFKTNIQTLPLKVKQIFF